MSNQFKRVALVSRPHPGTVGDTVREIAAFLRERGLEVMMEERTAETIDMHEFDPASLECMGSGADLAIAVGGDGTMLGAARALAPHGVPLIGINHGRLGFITDIGLDSWRQALAAILEGHHASEERTLLTACVVREGKTVWHELALNDVVVNRSSRTGMIELQVHVDDLYMYSQRADGLIVATPTGSTAYALSANGPILHPQLAGIVLVPVAPQSLSNRPIALPDAVTITIRVLEGREPRVAGDMQVFSDLQVGDDIIVKRAPFRARFLHPPGYSYFATLRGKLNWHELPNLQAIQR
ncbi:MAG: NAD kinase [Burkholderiaceae bacterium]|nr:NAD kinase [Burkholderiaceae bacterium]